jgi:hypothetical protein
MGARINTPDRTVGFGRVFGESTNSWRYIAIPLTIEGSWIGYDMACSQQQFGCVTLPRYSMRTPSRSIVATILCTALLMLPVRAGANTCSAKRIKVKHVCGVVVDDSGKPVEQAVVQVISTNNKPLSTPVVTGRDGRFSLNALPRGEFLLLVTANQHNTVRWPIKITSTNNKGSSCKKMLVVHLAGYLLAGCGDWVDKKMW